MKCLCILMVTVSDNDSDALPHCVQARDGYLLKDRSQRMVDALLLAGRAGQLVLQPPVNAHPGEHLLREEKDDRKSLAAQLTAREKQILGMIAVGNSNKLIANALASPMPR